MLAQPPLQQQRVERLLHVRRRRRAARRGTGRTAGVFGQQHARRAEDGALADDARHAADVLRRDLRAQQRAARQARLGRRLAHDVRLADAGRREQQQALRVRQAADQALRLGQRDGLAVGHELFIHFSTSPERSEGLFPLAGARGWWF